MKILLHVCCAVCAGAVIEKLKQDSRHAEHVNFAEINAAIEKELARTKAVKRWRKLKNIE